MPLKIKYKKTLIAFIILVVLIGGSIAVVSSRRGGQPEFDTAEVTPTSVVQDVSLTGRVEPTETYDLSFATSGVVRTITVKEGDSVTAGQTLATLDVADVAMQQAQAKAAFVGDQQTATVAVTKSKTALTETVRVNNQKIEEAKEAVRSAKTRLDNAQDQFERIKSEDDDATAAAYLSAESTYISTLNAYRAAQDALAVVQASSAQAQKLAQADVASAEQALKLTQDTISPGTLSANRAALGYQNAVLGKSILRAPAVGVVASINPQIGEYTTPATPTLSLVTTDLHMRALVPEADIAKLALGDAATVTLDAYGEDVEFTGVVTHIDQTETLTEGVATYEVLLRFNTPDARIRSGMTANIAVHADRRDNVLAVPQRAIIIRGDERMVRVVDGETFREVPVETGLRGSDALVEITHGLAAGDRVVIFINES